MSQRRRYVGENHETIERHSGFLTTRILPHNFASHGKSIFDHPLWFGGSKGGCFKPYDNYNRPLEKALLFYVRNNRTEEEMLSLKLMRIYRLGELILYHTDKLEKTSGDLHTLTKKRVEFWTSVLEALLHNTLVSEEIVREYKKIRDALRSPEERKRQKGLH